MYPTFDEINNRYSFCGTNNNSINYLYTLDASNGHIIYNPPFPTFSNASYNLIETRYDNSTGKLYALYSGPKNIGCSIKLSSSNMEISPSGTNGTATITASGGAAPYTYVWNTTPSQTTPTAIGLQAGIYTVTVIDNNGCSNSDTINMNVDVLTNIFVPDAFAPNSNVLPENQTLFVSGKGIVACDFIVYDRWGEKVFESNSWNDYTKGWNGIYKGKELPDDVFVYYAKATYNNGEEVEKKGNVSLIRK
jgi:gliding motility-associated-like protein